MARPLPYPGYSWSFTQHAAAFDPQTIYLMLQSALPFEGGTVRCGSQITALMMGFNLLTPNKRDGIDSAWRDYQQVLSEFGLIYSTEISQTLLLTDMGHMYVAGSIGYSELMNQQVLRYQYPNGQKFTIQSRIRNALGGTAYEGANNIAEVMTLAGVMLKPGLLIMRVLLELLNGGHQASVTLFECRKFVMPSKSNLEWPSCVQEIIASRSINEADDRSHRHAQRNIQDWFKFLNQSDIFDRGPDGTLSLSQIGMQMHSELLIICSEGEDPTQFWAPADSTVESRLSWFSWYGGLSLSDQPMIPQDASSDPDYVAENFVAGVEDPDDEDDITPGSLSDLVLTPIDLETLGLGEVSAFQGDTEKLIEAMLHGFQKRQAKAILHDQIVKEVAAKLQERGAVVSCGQSSIDLLATWPSGESAMFEVKTVTKRSLQTRLRSAIGQLHEYQYRQTLQGMKPSDLVVAINSKVGASMWQSKFITEHMQMGLLCKTGSGYIGAGPANLQTLPHWETI